MQLSIHPAPGVGELMPGWFVVPQNPLRQASQFVNGRAVVALADEQTRAGYTPRIGELVAASFTVPQNPLVSHLSGCGCGGSCGCASCASGMGFLGLPDTVSGIPTNYLLLGAGAALLLLTLGGRGSAYRSSLKSAREKYRKDVARIRAEYPRLAGRVRRSYRAAREAF